MPCHASLEKRDTHSPSSRSSTPVAASVHVLKPGESAFIAVVTATGDEVLNLPEAIQNSGDCGAVISSSKYFQGPGFILPTPRVREGCDTLMRSSIS